MRFDDVPDYTYLRKLFRDLFIREGYEYDCVFDWDLRSVDRRPRAIPPGLDERVIVSFSPSKVTVLSYSALEPNRGTVRKRNRHKEFRLWGGKRMTKEPGRPPSPDGA